MAPWNSLCVQSDVISFLKKGNFIIQKKNSIHVIWLLVATTKYQHYMLNIHTKFYWNQDRIKRVISLLRLVSFKVAAKNRIKWGFLPEFLSDLDLRGILPVARFSIKYILSGVLESFYYRIGFSKKCVVRVISPESSFIAQSDVIFFQGKENLLKRKKNIKYPKLNT